MENEENNQEVTVVDTLIGILKKDAKHLTPLQLINYTELFEAASKVCEERDWVWAMFNIMFREVGYPPLYMRWESLIINFLKEEERFTPEQINGYIALVKAASKAAPEDYWVKPIMELIRRGLGYKFWAEYELTL